MKVSFVQGCGIKGSACASVDGPIPKHIQMALRRLLNEIYKEYIYWSCELTTLGKIRDELKWGNREWLWLTCILCKFQTISDFKNRQDWVVTMQFQLTFSLCSPKHCGIEQNQYLQERNLITKQLRLGKCFNLLLPHVILAVPESMIEF